MSALGRGVKQLRGTETGPGIIRLTIHPVDHAPVKPAHGPFVRFAIKDLGLLRREQAARALHGGVAGEHGSGRRQGLVKKFTRLFATILL